MLSGVLLCAAGAAAALWRARARAAHFAPTAAAMSELAAGGAAAAGGGGIAARVPCARTRASLLVLLDLFGCMGALRTFGNANHPGAAPGRILSADTRIHTRNTLQNL